MKLMVQSWDETAGPPAAYNAETEETKFRAYSIEHQFGEPAKAIIKIADIDGSIMQKYNADSGDIYLGVGKITIEDPDGTDYFFGRVKRVSGNSFDKTVTLECHDWLDQLDEEQITYDMREDLDGSGLRQSEAHADADLAKAYLVDAGVKTLFSAQADDGGGFTDDTVAANDDTTDDMTLLPLVPVNGDAYYFGFESQMASMILNISQTGVWSGTINWEYWDGDSWESLTKTDPGNSKWLFEVVSGETGYAWTVPGDWAKTTVNGVEAYYIRAVVAGFTGITTQPLGERCWSEYYLYDDDMAWDTTPGNVKNFDGMFLLFTVGMAGKKTWRFFPYQATGTDFDVYGDQPHLLWHDDDTVDGGNADNDWTIDYDFHVELGHDTPSDFYVHDSITGARVFISYLLTFTGNQNHVHLQIDDKTDGWINLDHLDEIDHFHRETFDLTSAQYVDIVDANGIATVRFDIDRIGGLAAIAIKHLYLEVDVVTTGYSSSVAITETEANRVRVTTDLTAAATRIWEAIPYCIARPIYKHFDSEEIGTLISDYDGIVQLTHAGTIEHTSGLSTRQYKEQTSLQMMQDLATQDKSVFWITLGGTTITYKQTFGADTQQLTDAKVNSWTSYMDYGAMINEIHAYGARIGDYEIFQSATDTTSETTFNATRTKVLRDTGMVSDADALARATALAARDANPSLMVGCTITGNTVTAAHATTIKLGEIVEITSSYLWPTAARDYVVTRLVYDSERHETNLTLHPKVSIGYQELETSRVLSNQIADQARRGSSDKFVPDPITHEVS